MNFNIKLLAMAALFASASASNESIIAVTDDPKCTKEQCKTWSDFCDDWDDMVKQCYHACQPYCMRNNYCNNEKEQDKSAYSPTLKQACPAKKLGSENVQAPFDVLL